MTGPHQNQQLRTAGESLDEAQAAVILVHGRGATAQSILGMADEFEYPDIAYLAPQAANRTWYPQSFLAPVEQNEPGRSSGLQVITSLVSQANDADIPTEKILVLGFSQGACLASEFIARNPTRYGGLAALSGGLIGDTIEPDSFDGSLDSTPAFFGCSDSDPHIPEERVHDSAAVYEQLDASVTKRLYPGMGHGINKDELDFVDGMVGALVE